MKPEKKTSSGESSIGSVTHAPETVQVPKVETGASPAGTGSLDELKALEAQFSQGKPRSAASDASGVQGTDAGGAPVGEPRRRRKFKKIPPENTVRLGIRQYWRFQDWMKRRQFGLPSEYAGVFIQNEAGLVEPLVEPVIACMDEFLPEEWVVLIEEKSPLLMLCFALFETHQTFSNTSAKIAAELKASRPSEAPPTPKKERMPGLTETTGVVARSV